MGDNGADPPNRQRLYQPRNLLALITLVLSFVFIATQTPRIFKSHIHYHNDVPARTNRPTSLETIYQNRRDDKPHITIGQQLLETTDFLKSLADLKVDTGTSRWRLNDVCQKDVASTSGDIIGKLAYVKAFEDIIRRLSPCNIISPLNCFADVNLVFSSYGMWDTSVDWINDLMFESIGEKYIEDPTGTPLEALTTWGSIMVNHTAQYYPALEEGVARQVDDWLQALNETIGSKMWIDPLARLDDATWIPVENRLNPCEVIDSFNAINSDRQEKWTITGRIEQRTKLSCSPAEVEAFTRWLKTDSAVEFVSTRPKSSFPENDCLKSSLHVTNMTSIYSFPTTIQFLHPEDLMKQTVETLNTTQAEDLISEFQKEIRRSVRKWEAVTSEFYASNLDSEEEIEEKMTIWDFLIPVAVIATVTSFIFWRSQFIQNTFWFVFRMMLTASIMVKIRPKGLDFGPSIGLYFFLFIYLNFLTTTLLARFKTKTVFLMNDFEKRRLREYTLLATLIIPVPLFLTVSIYLFSSSIEALVPFFSLIFGSAVEALFTSDSYLASWRFERESHNETSKKQTIEQQQYQQQQFEAQFMHLPPESRDAMTKQMMASYNDRHPLTSVTHAGGIVKIVSQSSSDCLWKLADRIFRNIKRSNVKTTILGVSSVLVVVSIFILFFNSPTSLVTRGMREKKNEMIQMTVTVFHPVEVSERLEWNRIRTELERNEIHELKEWKSLDEVLMIEGFYENMTETAIKKASILELYFPVLSTSSEGVLEKYTLLRKYQNERIEISGDLALEIHEHEKTRNNTVIATALCTLFAPFVLFITSRRVLLSLTISLLCLTTVLEVFALALVLNISKLPSSQLIPFLAFSMTWATSLWHLAAGSWPQSMAYPNMKEKETFRLSCRQYLSFCIGYTSYRILLHLFDSSLNVPLIQFDLTLVLAGFNSMLVLPVVQRIFPDFVLELADDSVEMISIHEVTKHSPTSKRTSPTTSNQAMQLPRKPGKDDDDKPPYYSDDESSEDEENCKPSSSTSSFRRVPVLDLFTSMFTTKPQRVSVQQGMTVEAVPMMLSKEQFTKEVMELGLENRVALPAPPPQPLAIMEQINEEDGEEVEEDTGNESSDDEDEEVVVEVIEEDSDGEQVEQRRDSDEGYDESEDEGGFGGAEL